MVLRHEQKHEINYSDMLALRSRLGSFMQQDPNAKNGEYFIRSLYFDNINDKALLEKLNGISVREKFRIRYYNGDTSYIVLEKKSKINDLCAKESEQLTVDEVKLIMQGAIKQSSCDKPLLSELIGKMSSQGLKPKTIVDYTREPFIYAPGNVRVTLDYNIRTGILCTDFLDTECVTVPAGDSVAVLEVKWDSYLPDIVKHAVQLKGRHTSAFSKYAACRVYG